MDYRTPGYTCTSRTYRIVGIGTIAPVPATESDRVEAIARKALAALLAKIGSRYMEVPGRLTMLSVEHESTTHTYTIPAPGRYRIIGLQPLAEPCAYCDRSGSVKWGGTWACTEHADHEGLVWDAVRRCRAAASQAMGPEYKVSITLAIDPRLAAHSVSPTPTGDNR